MPVDARIQNIEDIASSSKHLGSFMESMNHNFMAFNKVMMQKLLVLSGYVQTARQIESEAMSEYTKCYNNYAYCPTDKNEERSRLLFQLKQAEHKKAKAMRLREEIVSQYNIANAAVRCMYDNTKMINTKLHNNIDKGRSFLNKAFLQLSQYAQTSQNNGCSTTNE